MKIFTPEQIKEIEIQTVNKQGIELKDLMERAAKAIFDRLVAEYPHKSTAFIIFCGAGNNGGDGLALARLLSNSGRNLRVFLQKSEKYSNENQQNQNRLQHTSLEVEYLDGDTAIEFPEGTIVIDAIFGCGLNRPVSGTMAGIVQKINNSGCRVISVDLPSGMYSDKLNKPDDTIIKADLCLSFDSPKLSMLLAENSGNIRDFEILDLGFDKDVVYEHKSKYYYTTDLSKYKRERDRFSYKYNYGNVLVLGGSFGKIGAVHLSLKAALRSGAGLLTAYLPKCGYQTLQTTIPEAMLICDFSDDKIIGFPDIKRYDTIAIGPGLGTDDRTIYGLEQFIAENDFKNKKLIIDADGINILSKNRNLLKILPDDTILTPHDKELERLTGQWTDTYDKFEKISKLTNEYNLIVVSKGAFTQIHTTDGEIHFNSTGNPGMATAGSGDVLTGVIAGLLGRGHSARDAAILGTYIHGLGGDLAAEKTGKESLISSDIIDYLPEAFRRTFG